MVAERRDVVASPDASAPRERPGQVRGPRDDRIRVSRRRFLLTTAASAAAGGLALAGVPVMAASPTPSMAQGASSSPAPPTAPPATPSPSPSGPPPEAIVRYRSRPDLRPPLIEVRAASPAGDDLLFVTPRFSGQGEGVMLMDAPGRLVWLHRVPGTLRGGAAAGPLRRCARHVVVGGCHRRRAWVTASSSSSTTAYREAARIRTVVSPRISTSCSSPRRTRRTRSPWTSSRSRASSSTTCSSRSSTSRPAGCSGSGAPPTTSARRVLRASARRRTVGIPAPQLHRRTTSTATCS